MSTRQYLSRILHILMEDRLALWHGHVNPASGKVEDAGAREALAEYDECIAWLENTLKQIKEAAHV